MPRRGKIGGYLSANKDKKYVMVCVFGNGEKKYMFCDLNDALDVVTGKRSYVNLRERVS